MVLPIWTQEEIRKYDEIRDPRLEQLYSSRGLSSENPEARARFLAEVLDLNLNQKYTIARAAVKEGRHAAMELLENLAVEKLSRE